MIFISAKVIVKCLSILIAAALLPNYSPRILLQMTKFLFI